jgi:hypothetical protein
MRRDAGIHLLMDQVYMKCDARIVFKLFLKTSKGFVVEFLQMDAGIPPQSSIVNQQMYCTITLPVLSPG